MGAAILLKQVAVFWLLFAAAIMLLALPLKKLIRDRQVWLMAVLAIFPVAIYNLYGIFISKTLAGQYSQRFFPHLWIEPGFYLQWVDKIGETVGVPFFLLFVIGIGLIYLIYGPGAATLGFICLLGAMLPVVLILLFLFITDWIVKRAGD